MLPRAVITIFGCRGDRCGRSHLPPPSRRRAAAADMAADMVEVMAEVMLSRAATAAATPSAAAVTATAAMPFTADSTVFAAADFYGGPLYAYGGTSCWRWVPGAYGPVRSGCADGPARRRLRH